MQLLLLGVTWGSGLKSFCLMFSAIVADNLDYANPNDLLDNRIFGGRVFTMVADSATVGRPPSTVGRPPSTVGRPP